jgi:biopolymer transport protein ExbD
MKKSRRIARMSRNRPKVPGLNLTSLVDVFTILVFFLLVNSATTEVLTEPKLIKLPDSIAEMKPRETVVVFIGQDEVLVQGEAVVRVADIEAMQGHTIPAIGQRLAALRDKVIGIRTQTIAQSHEVTVLADRAVPFSIVKKVMSTCTGQGYGRISLAVVQKSPPASKT